MNVSAPTSSASLLSRYHSLPRALKWLVWLGIGLIAYFAILDPVLKTMTELHDRSEQALKAIRTYRDPDQDNRNMIRDGHKRWGNVLLPGADQSRVLEAKTAIAQVLKDHNLTRDVSLTERSPSTLKGTESTASGVQYMRGPIELKFSAASHVAMAVIADLEMVPSIAQIASIRIRRHTDKAEVEVTLVADAWFIRQGS